MKSRKGYQPITVDGIKYIYNVCLNAGKIFLYNVDDKKIVLDMKTFPKEKFTYIHPLWRGKHEDACWNKVNVATLIRVNL